MIIVVPPTIRLELTRERQQTLRAERRRIARFRQALDRR